MNRQDGSNVIIRCQNINVNGAQFDTGVFIGENRQPFWSSHGKYNTILGFITGQCMNIEPYSMMFDPDIIDSIIYDDDAFINPNYK
jgi:hypothetical protein